MESEGQMDALWMPFESWNQRKGSCSAMTVLQMNKMWYKDGKRDPCGFKSFLDSEKLPHGFILRYRGNRLHVLFHICGKYHEKHDAMLRYLRCGTTALRGADGSVTGLPQRPPHSSCKFSDYSASY